MQSEPRCARTPVWALPLSLAATYGIDVSFSSSAYLDVSVQRVPSVNLWIQSTVTGLSPGRVSPFRYLRIAGYLLLPEAFRSLSRLSSALSAKASALCSFLLNLTPPMHSVAWYQVVLFHLSLDLSVSETFVPETLIP